MGEKSQRFYIFMAIGGYAQSPLCQDLPEGLSGAWIGWEDAMDHIRWMRRMGED